VPEDKISTINCKYLFEVGKNKTINGNVKENTARYINHSCRPNCEADGPEGRVFIFSLKNIKAGEELTYDYGEEYFDEYLSRGRCLCVKCKK
jgi:SET domain-containing protein